MIKTFYCKQCKTHCQHYRVEMWRQFICYSCGSAIDDREFFDPIRDRFRVTDMRVIRQPGKEPIVSTVTTEPKDET